MQPCSYLNIAAFSPAAVERRLAAAETTRMHIQYSLRVESLETCLRERDSEIERLDVDIFLFRRCRLLRTFIHRLREAGERV
jgi:hypothetical protein